MIIDGGLLLGRAFPGASIEIKPAANSMRVKKTKRSHISRMAWENNCLSGKKSGQVKQHYKRSANKKVCLMSGLSEIEQMKMVEDRPSDIRYIDAPTPAVQFTAALRDIRVVKMIHGPMDILVSDYAQHKHKHKHKGEFQPSQVLAVDK